ncbi:hypothetical protein PQC07_gp136 [Aeromonas phage D3]|uniref:Uncharacterized protein n=2 Tax=Ludhianavirus TaxID=3044751 RepID=A0A514TVU1_9CAUD|nr:hypothetical protein PQC07_gp136 [Aeromonas phage D3]YP_010668887.1 hypothetical protein PQC08_gp136 [Aeromonas phage D6]QDJ97137.1 hypothetical protein D3_0139 [Aeromonas phage D3]QDJ97299.1 hypothetical protein D6_0139 [Aeromonas phage D6]QEP52444.1 hypothetical protein D9_0237 [Aeromonas phage D9]
MIKFRIFCGTLWELIVKETKNHKRGVTAAIIILLTWVGAYATVKYLFKAGELMLP